MWVAMVFLVIGLALSGTGQTTQPGDVIDVLNIKENVWQICYAQTGEKLYFEECETESLPRGALIWIATNSIRQGEFTANLGVKVAELELKVAGLKRNLKFANDRILYLEPYYFSYMRAKEYRWYDFVSMSERDLIIKAKDRVE